MNNLGKTYYELGEYEKTLETLKRIPLKERDKTSTINIKAVKHVLKEQREAKKSRYNNPPNLYINGFTYSSAQIDKHSQNRFFRATEKQQHSRD